MAYRLRGPANFGGGRIIIMAGDGRGMWLLSKGQRAEPEQHVPDTTPLPEPELTPQLAASAQAIGGRYEMMNSALDSIGRLMEQLRGIEPLMAEIKGPLQQEYETRRAEHSELTALRHMHETMEAALYSAQAQERDAIGKLAAAEMGLGESEAVRATQATTLEERAIEIDRLRNDLLQLELRAQHLDSALRDATARNDEMEHDVTNLRGHLEEVDRRRAEAESGLARATQDNALLAEETAVLKKRYEQSSSEVARLTRIENDLETQLAAERARVTASEAAALATQAESTRVIRQLETQLELIRSELSATQTRLETSAVRASKLEELNTQLGARLNDAGSRQQLAERAIGERQTVIDRQAERVRLLEEESESLRQRHAAVETARAAAVERADQLAKSLAGHERAVERAEGRAGQVRTKLEKLMAAHEAALPEQEQRIEALQKDVERSRAEAALAEGALETVRRDRDRLQVALFGNASAAA